MSNIEQPFEHERLFTDRDIYESMQPIDLLAFIRDARNEVSKIEEQIELATDVLSGYGVDLKGRYYKREEDGKE